MLDTLVMFVTVVCALQADRLLDRYLNVGKDRAHTRSGQTPPPQTGKNRFTWRRP